MTATAKMAKTRKSVRIMLPSAAPRLHVLGDSLAAPPSHTPEGSAGRQISRRSEERKRFALRLPPPLALAVVRLLHLEPGDRPSLAVARRQGRTE